MRQLSSIELIAGVSLLGIVALALYGLFLFNTFTHAAALAEQPAAIQSVAPTEPALQESTSFRVQESVAAEEVTPTPLETPQPVEQPVRTKPALEHADQLTAAGIAESDQAIAESLIFIGSDWNLFHCNCGSTAMVATNPVSRLKVVNSYVLNNYGTWTAAQEQAATGNW
jgi:hypothetical protein